MSSARKLLIATGIAALVAIVVVSMRSSSNEIASIAGAAREEVSEHEGRVAPPPSISELPSGAVANDARVEVVSNPPASSGMEIHGRVVDEMGKAIERFALAATHLSERTDVVEQLELPLAQHANGEFDLVDLAPGRWAVEPQIVGMKVADEPQFEGPTPRRVDFAMFRVGVVRVSVFDAQRRPIENAVPVIDGETRDGRTNARGVLELKLEPGNHEVSAIALGFVESAQQMRYVSPRFRASDVVLTMYRAATVRGTLSTVSGKPAPDYRVSSSSGATTTDAAGQFELTGLGVGRVRMSFSVAVDGGTQSSALIVDLELREAEVKQIALLLPRERPVRVVGQVTSASLESGDLTFVACDGQLTTGEAFSAEVDANGAFAVMLPSIGCYRIRISRTSRDGSQVLSDAGTIDVPDQDVFELPSKL